MSGEYHLSSCILKAARWPCYTLGWLVCSVTTHFLSFSTRLQSILSQLQHDVWQMISKSGTPIQTLLAGRC